MKTRMMVAAIAVLVSGAVVADEVDQLAVTEFQSGQPALAAEVNANFDALISSINDNDSRLDALEVAVSMPANSVQITVDCDADAAALANAVATGSLAVGLDITASGTCDAVLIDRDHVAITGPATIVSNALGDNPVEVNGATNVFLNNLTIDGTGAETALSIRYNSSVVATNIEADGALDTTVWVQFNSTLRLDGMNTISSDGGIAFELSANAIGLSFGTTTLTSSDRPFLMDAGALAGGVFNINGGEVEIGNGSALFFSGTINVGLVTVQQNSDLNLATEGDDIVINADLNIFSFSNVLFDTRDGGTVTHTGNIVVSTGRMAALGPTGTNNTISIAIPAVGDPAPKVRLSNQSLFRNANATVASNEIEIRTNSTVTFGSAGAFGGLVDLALGAYFFGVSSADTASILFECAGLGPEFAYLFVPGSGFSESCNP